MHCSQLRVLCLLAVARLDVAMVRGLGSPPAHAPPLPCWPELGYRTPSPRGAARSPPSDAPPLLRGQPSVTSGLVDSGTPVPRESSPWGGAPPLPHLRRLAFLPPGLFSPEPGSSSVFAAAPGDCLCEHCRSTVVSLQNRTLRLESLIEMLVSREGFAAVTSRLDSRIDSLARSESQAVALASKEQLAATTARLEARIDALVARVDSSLEMFATRGQVAVAIADLRARVDFLAGHLGYESRGAASVQHCFPMPVAMPVPVPMSELVAVQRSVSSMVATGPVSSASSPSSSARPNGVPATSRSNSKFKLKNVRV